MKGVLIGGAAAAAAIGGYFLYTRIVSPVGHVARNVKSSSDSVTSTLKSIARTANDFAGAADAVSSLTGDISGWF